MCRPVEEGRSSWITTFPQAHWDKLKADVLWGETKETFQAPPKAASPPHAAHTHTHTPGRMVPLLVTDRSNETWFSCYTETKSNTSHSARERLSSPHVRNSTMERLVSISKLLSCLEETLTVKHHITKHPGRAASGRGSGWSPQTSAAHHSASSSTSDGTGASTHYRPGRLNKEFPQRSEWKGRVESLPSLQSFNGQGKRRHRTAVV